MVVPCRAASLLALAPRPLKRLLLIALALLPLAPAAAWPGGVGISVEGHGLDTLNATYDAFNPLIRKFQYYRIPAFIDQVDLRLARRDLRFHWSDSTYAAHGGATLVPDPFAWNDLSWLGHTLLYEPRNPFNWDLPDLQFVHDYLIQTNALYDDRPDVANGFRLPYLSSPYGDDDRNHIDAYIYYPKTLTGPGDRDSFPNTGNRGTWPSEYVWASAGRYEIARIASRISETQGPALELSQAGHSRLGAMDPASGMGSPVVDDGDTVALAYTATNDPGARAEPWIVLLSNPVPSEPASLRSTTPAVAQPTAFALHPGRPNPFRSEVAIGFDLPVANPVRIEIHDLQGRLVSVIANAAYPAGRHEVRWNRRNRTGSLAAPGVYLYSMTAGEFRARRRMIALP